MRFVYYPSGIPTPFVIMHTHTYIDFPPRELTVKHLEALDKPKVQSHFGTRNTKFKGPRGISALTKTREDRHVRRKHVCVYAHVCVDFLRQSLTI